MAAEPRASAPRSARGPAIAGLVFACACWGLSFPLGKALGDLHARLVPGADSGILALGILAPRFVLATLVLGLALRPRWGAISRAEWRLGLGLGAFSGGGVLLQFEAMQHTSATVSAFLTQFYVVLIPLFLALRRRRAPGWHVAASVALVLAGVAVLARLDFSDLRIGRGEAGTIAATVFFTGQILWLGRKEFADCRPGVCTLLMFAVQGAGFVIIAAARAPVAETFGPLLGSGAWWLFMALLTGFSTLAAFLLMNVWQPRITPTEAGLIYCAEPLFTSVWAAFLPGIFSAWAGIAYANEPFTRVLLLGGALITVANVWIQFAPRRS